MRRSSLFSLSALLAVAVSALASCAPLPPPPPPPPPPGPLPQDDWRPAAPRPSRDWREVVTAFDADRLARLDEAWIDALRQARSLQGSGDLASLGVLIYPRAARAPVNITPGDYRCRTVKLGSQMADGGLGYVVYGWFDCRIEATANGLKFVKATGSQRPSGLLFPDTSEQMVMLGSMALADDPPANSYGRTPDRDMVAVLERIGSSRWRLVIPWPRNESKLDLIELVPA